ncbi:DUF1707 SHOCT-like domain-containing protein [Streptomyces caatingaensis]|uniref:DUF1707 domain-containing protein n=1 Tax=Streptomyces caatingaensis TaxID=1678637 RepID=A0A0K9XL18_9ACTN|nr:DUF1707 domain-containing protein [Streptomyces caatingaensis]KNB53998.1 hypothetical protein AC230_05435 [Streptomyces caatingaensis]
MTAHTPDAASVPWAEQRASHADRDAVVRRLQQAAAEGRLDFHELDERLEQALTAKTFGALAALTADLRGADGEAGEPVPGRPPVLKGGMHGIVRTGRWKVPPRLTAYGGMGGVVLDLTRVESPPRVLDFEVHGQMAGVTVVIPDDWSAETDGVEPGLGGVKDRTTPDRSPDAPLVRLTGTGGMAGIVVRHPKARERRRLEREGRALAAR